MAGLKLDIMLRLIRLSSFIHWENQFERMSASKVANVSALEIADLKLSF